MKKTIVLGYGNPDREDDGVAWHLLNKLIAKLNLEDVDLFNGEVYKLSESLDIWFNLQLLPEISETIADYERVFFLDAHTGEIEKDINFEPVEPKYMNSPFSHHMTPSTVLYLTNNLKGSCPEAWLLSVRGYKFQFTQKLSEKTRLLAEEALKFLEEELFG
jgi:hydrogenase maturation protease